MQFTQKTAFTRRGPDAGGLNCHRTAWWRQRWLKTMLLVMRLTIILMTVGLLQVQAKGLSQSITLTGKNIPIQEVFAAIELQTGYSVFGNLSLLEKARPVSVDARNMKLEEFLSVVMKDQPFNYTLSAKTIILGEKRVADLGPRLQSSVIPPITIRGRIVDESGEPVVAASVAIKGTKRGTTSNANGEFLLNDVMKDAVLVVTATNIEKQEVALASRRLKSGTDNVSVVIISVNKSSESLNEVIINKGYYTETQRLSTGSVSVVKAKDIDKQPVSNPLLAMQGRVPGMVITQSTGWAGSGVTVRIRGANSVVNGNDPLYIIDGVPYSSQLLIGAGTTLGSSGATNNNIGGNPLSFISPGDIESIEILKDADATAIYGSRGANGVVLITTKRGKSGQPAFDFNFYSGVGKVAHFIDLLNTQQFIAIRKEAFKNDGQNPETWNAPDLLTWDQNVYTDWQERLMGGTANYTKAQASVSGGNDNFQYLLGSTYKKETTVFPTNLSDNRGSVHFNIKNTSSNKRLSLLFSANYLTDVNDVVFTDPTLYSLLAPNFPSPYNNDGSLKWTDGINPFSLFENKYNIRTKNLISSGIINYNVLKGLDVKVSAGYNNLDINEISKSPVSGIDPARNVTSGSSIFVRNNIQSWIVEPSFNYAVNIKDHRVNILVGSTLQQTTSSAERLNATGFNSDDLLENIRAAVDISALSATHAEYNYSAVFTRLNYNFRERYLVNFTARRDGTSRFARKNRFHNFSAVGVGYLFTLPFISSGKIRSSYGTSGNDQVGDYRYMDLYSFTQYNYQGGIGLYPGTLVNHDLAWEKTKKFETGLELGFLRNKIFLVVNYYKNSSSNQLVEYPLPAVTGFGTVSRNLPAKVENRGWEIMLSTTNIHSKKIKWTSSINIAVPVNKLTAFPDLAKSSYASQFVIGESITALKVYKFGGIDTATGSYQFLDKDAKLVNFPVFPDDQTAVVNTMPEFHGGLSNNIQAGNFEVDFLFQFVKQKGINPATSWIFVPTESAYYNYPASILDRWQQPGDVSSYGAATQTYTTAYFSYFFAKQSDYAYTDASFIRLKNLSLSYKLPVSWIQKAKLRNCRIYLQGQNLLTFTRYKGNDPETQSLTALPALRVLTAGIQLGL